MASTKKCIHSTARRQKAEASEKSAMIPLTGESGLGQGGQVLRESTEWRGVGKEKVKQGVGSTIY